MKYKCPKCGKVIGATEDIMDQQVVERFNELVKEGRIGWERQMSFGNVIDNGTIYRLLPTPRYRPYNTSDSFKLDELCGLLIVNRIDRKKREQVRALFCGGFALESGRDITWDEAANDWLVADTGEPFGVKVIE